MHVPIACMPTVRSALTYLYYWDFIRFDNLMAVLFPVPTTFRRPAKADAVRYSVDRSYKPAKPPLLSVVVSIETFILLSCKRLLRYERMPIFIMGDNGLTTKIGTLLQFEICRLRFVSTEENVRSSGVFIHCGPSALGSAPATGLR